MHRAVPGAAAMTRVVHVDDTATPFTVYIGRFAPWKRLQASKWHNPFKVGRDGTIKEVLQKYEARLMSNSDLVAAIPDLRGEVLGCWCKSPRGSGESAGKPEGPTNKSKPDSPCHGDVLARLADGPLGDRRNAPSQEDRRAPREDVDS